MTVIFWRCDCGLSFFTDTKPRDHWRTRLDGGSMICRGPFTKWEGRRLDA